MRTSPIVTGPSRRRSEAGGAGIKLIVSLVLLAVVSQALYIFIPIYIAVYDFTSQLDKEAQFGSSKRDEQIKDGLLKYAADLDLPVDKKALKVVRSPNKLSVSVEFMVPVKTLLYTYEWQVSTEKSYPLF